MSSPSTPGTEGVPLSAAALDPCWWAPGLTLRERVATAEHVTETAAETARARIARWRARYDAQGAGLFAERLAAVGLDENTLLRLLAEPPASLAARTARPAWASAVEQAVRSAEPLQPDAPVPASWPEAFAMPLRSEERRVGKECLNLV